MNPDYIGYNVNLHKLTGTVPGTWEWGDGTPLSYNRWGSTQPNYIHAKTVVLLLPDIQFNDVPDTLVTSFICEKNV